MEWLLALALGIGLSAACGFRVFVPLLIMSIASHTGHMTFGHGFGWMDSWVATGVFAVATIVEIGAYLIPWLDHALDVITTPAAVIAGAIVTASVLGEMSPLLRWTLAIIAGGGAAGIVQGTTVALRGASTVTTAGIANPGISAAESAASLITSILAIVVPVLAAAVVVVICIAMVRRVAARPRFKPL
ncbi:DUF4126 domain-containing protein [Candidatus Fermentibacteria bacterium]|nr:DUF4126 domain-containing protein [Candidatus Fermentibacteria bacterium]